VEQIINSGVWGGAPLPLISMGFKVMPLKIFNKIYVESARCLKNVNFKVVFLIVSSMCSLVILIFYTI